MARKLFIRNELNGSAGACAKLHLETAGRCPVLQSFHCVFFSRIPLRSTGVPVRHRRGPRRCLPPRIADLSSTGATLLPHRHWPAKALPVPPVSASRASCRPWGTDLSPFVRFVRRGDTPPKRAGSSRRQGLLAVLARPYLKREQPPDHAASLNRYPRQLVVLPATQKRNDKTRPGLEKGVQPNLGEPLRSRNSCSTTQPAAVLGLVAASWLSLLLGYLCSAALGPGLEAVASHRPRLRRRACQARWFPARAVSALGGLSQPEMWRKLAARSPASAGSPRITAVAGAGKAIGLCPASWLARFDTPSVAGGTTVAARRIENLSRPVGVVIERDITAIASWPRQVRLRPAADLENPRAALDRSAGKPAGSPRRARQGGGRSGQHRADGPDRRHRAAACRQGANGPAMRHP